MENYDQLLFAPSDIAQTLAQRLKSIRKRKKITQHQLASRSNVSYASLCRFEQTGQISLESFIKLTMELCVIDEVKDLFTHPLYSSIEEVMNDLTYSNTYWGEQTTSVCGKGKNISKNDLIKTGMDASLSKSLCTDILNEIQEKTAVLSHYLNK